MPSTGKMCKLFLFPKFLDKLRNKRWRIHFNKFRWCQNVPIYSFPTKDVEHIWNGHSVIWLNNSSSLSSFPLYWQSNNLDKAHVFVLILGEWNPEDTFFQHGAKKRLKKAYLVKFSLHNILKSPKLSQCHRLSLKQTLYLLDKSCTGKKQKAQNVLTVFLHLFLKLEQD